MIPKKLQKRVSIASAQILPTSNSKEFDVKNHFDMKNQFDFDMKNQFDVKNQANLNNSNKRISELNDSINIIQKENILDLGDIFFKDFDKVAEFKNFYPEYNIKNVIKENNKRSHIIRQKRRATNIANMRRQSQIKKQNRKNSFKSPKSCKNNNKVTPEVELKVGFNIDEKNNKLKTDSNIFRHKSEAHLFAPISKNRFTFYDIVNEVLKNNELRKKLFALKQKSEKLKKRKYLF